MSKEITRKRTQKRPRMAPKCYEPERLALAQDARFCRGYEHDIKRFIVEYGRVFKPAPRPHEVRKRAAKRCFYNATMLAQIDSKFGYAEGYCKCAGTWFFEHAWNVQANTVVDSTLCDPEQATYIGIAVSPEQLWPELSSKSGKCGLLMVDWCANTEFMDRYARCHKRRAVWDNILQVLPPPLKARTLKAARIEIAKRKRQPAMNAPNTSAKNRD
jgi:hypothetical protein